MMGRQDRDQRQLFYEFSLDEVVPSDHLLRRMNVFVTGQHLKPLYSEIGRPSVDPELMIRMLIVGYCYGIRHERRLCEEVKLHLAYRWFCKLDLDDRVPHHSTFSISFARATSCATFLSVLLRHAWSMASSKVRVLRSTRV
jgi:transposase